MIAGLFISINVTNTHISVLFENWNQFADIFVQMSHPDWSYLNVVWPKLIETIKMAVLGTVIGSVVAFIYSLLIARNIVKNKAVTGVLRVIMNIVRTIPDLLLGAIFVAIVGIGPVAGILALAVFTFGVVVKLFYEAIETIDPGPIEAFDCCRCKQAAKLSITQLCHKSSLTSFHMFYTHLKSTSERQQSLVISVPVVLVLTCNKLCKSSITLKLVRLSSLSS